MFAGGSLIQRDVRHCSIQQIDFTHIRLLSSNFPTGFRHNQIGDYHGTATGKGLKFTCNADEKICNCLGKCWFLQVGQEVLLCLTLSFDPLTPHVEVPAHSTAVISQVASLKSKSKSLEQPKLVFLCSERVRNLSLNGGFALMCISRDRLWQFLQTADAMCMSAHTRVQRGILQLWNRVARCWFSVHSFYQIAPSLSRFLPHARLQEGSGDPTLPDCEVIGALADWYSSAALSTWWMRRYVPARSPPALRVICVAEQSMSAKLPHAQELLTLGQLEESTDRHTLS